MRRTSRRRAKRRLPSIHTRFPANRIYAVTAAAGWKKTLDRFTTFATEAGLGYSRYRISGDRIGFWTGNDSMWSDVPVSESEQIVDALRAAGREVRYLVFDDDGHAITKRENRARLAITMSEWLNRAFGATERLVEVS